MVRTHASELKEWIEALDTAPVDEKLHVRMTFEARAYLVQFLRSLEPIVSKAEDNG